MSDSAKKAIRVVPFFDRLAAQAERLVLKSSGGNVMTVAAQPTYTDEQIKSRTDFSEALTRLLETKLDSIGAFITPSGDKETGIAKAMKLALTLPIGAIQFQEEDGTVSTTRDTILNLTISIADSPKSVPDGPSRPAFVAMTKAERMAQIKNGNHK
jgi:hypothetical protein